MDEYYQAVASLPPWLSKPLCQLSENAASQIYEVRLRTGCEVHLNVLGILRPAGQIPGISSFLDHLKLTQNQMDEIFYYLCGGSVHSYQSELSEGFLTLSGGHRVGVGGRYLFHPGQEAVLQTVFSLNLRIARSKISRLPVQLQFLLKSRFTGLLVVGEPSSGKTTLLRSIAHFLADEGRAVSVVDEREELWAAQDLSEGMPPLDILSGLPKSCAVQMALRTLAPQVILLDELGTMEEVLALEQGFFSGVDLVASLHASSQQEAMRRPQVQYMTERNMLQGLVLLEGRQAPGRIKEVIQL